MLSGGCAAKSKRSEDGADYGSEDHPRGRHHYANEGSGHCCRDYVAKAKSLCSNAFA